MLISTYHNNPFVDIERSFDSLWEDDHFLDPFVTFTNSRKWRLSKKNQLKNKLSMLENEENSVMNTIQDCENQLKYLKKVKKAIGKQKSDFQNKISKLLNEKKKSNQNQSDESNVNSYIFKKINYKTDDMEIEEQYDSLNPKNCYKIIKKKNEAPQLIQSENSTKNTIDDSKGNHNEVNNETHNEGGETDEKYIQFSKIVGKNTTELKKLVAENKDLTIGQLFDKATELKLI